MGVVYFFFNFNKKNVCLSSKVFRTPFPWFGLGFNGLVKIIKVMSSRSVKFQLNLITVFLLGMQTEASWRLSSS